MIESNIWPSVLKVKKKIAEKRKTSPQVIKTSDYLIIVRIIMIENQTEINYLPKSELDFERVKATFD